MSGVLRWKTWSGEYALQLMLAVFAMVVGFVCDIVLDRFYYEMPFRQLAIFSIFGAGIAGYWVARMRRRSVGFFVWVPGFLLFLYTALSLAKTWNPAWAPSPRIKYVWESLFGPACTSQECIYTLPTDAFLGAVAYSLAAKLALLRLPKADAMGGRS
jgi:hypothetical protein